MTNPVVDVIVGASGDERDASRIGRVVPIYPASGKAGLTSWEVGGFIDESLRRVGPMLDPVPDAALIELDLIDRTSSYKGIHLPEEWGVQDVARRRLVFDEFLRLQLLLALRRRRMEESSAGIRHPSTTKTSTSDLGPWRTARRRSCDVLGGHHFALTPAQRRVLGEIAADLAAPLPMHRLLQGDVGSGKTVVALTALLASIDGGRQGALMAPTEVLAEQHLASLRKDLEGLTKVDDAVLGANAPCRFNC